MSISSSTRKAGPYSCNGSTVAFPFAFKVFTTADVRVVLTDTNAVESDLALGTNYTVALNADQDANPGGTVTTTATYATGYKITLASQVQNLQPVTLTNQGGFYPKIINDALDRLTILAQQLAEQVGRAVKTSISSSSSTPDQLLSDIGTAVTNASNSATAAAGSATASAGYATNSANSAAASAGSATAAANSATQAATNAAAVGFTITALQAQDKTAFTSAGTAPAFTVASSPAYGALTANQRMRVKFHAAGTTGSNTLNRDGLGAKNLKQYDSTGAKVAAVITAGQLADIEYDGTDMVVLDPLPPGNPAGLVKQVAQAFKNDVFSTSSTTFVDVTGMSVTVTPTSLSSKFLILCNLTAGMNGASSGSGQLVRNSTPISVGATASGYTPVSMSSFYGGSADGNNNETSTVTYVDSPNTLSPVTYKVQVAAFQGTVLVVNGLGSDISGQTYSIRAASSLIVMEVL